MKKIITLIMAFLVCAAMAVPAFASTADTTITGFSVNVYSAWYGKYHKAYYLPGLLRYKPAKKSSPN